MNAQEVCNELATINLEPMPDGGCEQCLALGDTWVHLRYCVECKGTHCCDDSKNQHARRHFESSGHAVIRSKEPGEFWAYCYIHEGGALTAEA